MTEAFECPVCYSDYDPTEAVPVIATCGHTVCKVCRPKLPGRKCPICMRKTFEKETLNYGLIALVEQMKENEQREKEKAQQDKEAERQQREDMKKALEALEQIKIVVNNKEKSKKEEIDGESETESDAEFDHAMRKFNSLRNDKSVSPKALLALPLEKNTGRATRRPDRLDITHPIRTQGQGFFPSNSRSSPHLSSSIYVKKFPLHWIEADLKDLFAPFGSISTIRIERDESGVSRGFGFVNFVKRTSALEAVKKLHEMKVGTKFLYVAIKEDRSLIDLTAFPNRSGYGSRIRYNNPYTSSRNKGSRPTTPNLANGDSSSSSTASVPVSDSDQKRKIFVKNFPPSWISADLTRLFTAFGNVECASVIRDPDGLSRGFGFVTFSEDNCVENAISRWNRMPLPGCRKPLIVKPATG